MPKTPPCHTCGRPLVRRGFRAGGVIQRWWCPACATWSVDRGAKTRLHAASRYGLGRVALGVAQGLSVHALAQIAGLDWVTVKRRMDRLEAAAVNRFNERPPRPGHGWALVDLPSATHAQGQAAVGRGRTTFRLLDWETGTKAGRTLEERLGPAPLVSIPGSQEWLTAALGSGARDWTEAEQRLWIILAQSNGWKWD